jgi:NADP-dependent 3-hydroxy acid dehydrogenase YdfG
MVMTEKKVALITGASSGIGRALAVSMAEHGYDLALFARRSDRLDELKAQIEELPERCVMTVSCDVREKADMAMNILQVAGHLGRIDVVVANAGYTIPGPFESLDVDDYRNIFDTNFFGMLNTIYPALPALKESQGTVIIVGSILGEFGIMDRSAYVSTKFAMRGFYESVRYELKENGISLLFVEPGFIKTELRFMDKKGNRFKVVTEKTVKKTSHGISVPPEIVANQVVKMLPAKGYKKKIITGHARLFAFLNWLCPGFIAWLIYRHRDFIRKKVIK